MRPLALFLLLLVLAPAVAPSVASAQNDSIRTVAGRLVKRNPSYPSMTGWVNDLEQDFSAAEVADLEKIISDCRAKDSIEISLLTEKDFEGDNVGAHASDIMSYWQVGGDQVSNGVLLYISKARRKVWISRGKVADQRLTHDACDAIVRKTLLPQFAFDKYFDGTRDALLAMVKALGH